MKPPFLRRDLSRRPQRGTTLVEVLWAVILLTVLAIAAGTFVSLSSGMMAVSRNQRTAVEIANSRLEDLRSAGFNSIKPPTQSYAVFYVRPRAGGGWDHFSSDPGETVRMLGWDYPIFTTIQYVDIDGGAPSYDVVQVNVAVRYRVQEPNTVRLWAYLGP